MPLTLTIRDGARVHLGDHGRIGAVLLVWSRAGKARLAFELPGVPVSRDEHLPPKHRTGPDPAVAMCSVRVFADWFDERPGQPGGEVSRQWMVDVQPASAGHERYAVSGLIPRHVERLPDALAWTEAALGLARRLDWEPQDGCLVAGAEIPVDDLRTAAAKLMHDDAPVTAG